MTNDAIETLTSDQLKNIIIKHNPDIELTDTEILLIKNNFKKYYINGTRLILNVDYKDSFYKSGLSNKIIKPNTKQSSATNSEDFQNNKFYQVSDDLSNIHDVLPPDIFHQGKTFACELEYVIKEQKNFDISNDLYNDSDISSYSIIKETNEKDIEYTYTLENDLDAKKIADKIIFNSKEKFLKDYKTIKQAYNEGENPKISIHNLFENYKYHSVIYDIINDMITENEIHNNKDLNNLYNLSVLYIDAKHERLLGFYNTINNVIFIYENEDFNELSHVLRHETYHVLYNDDQYDYPKYLEESIVENSALNTDSNKNIILEAYSEERSKQETLDIMLIANNHSPNELYKTLSNGDVELFYRLLGSNSEYDTFILYSSLRDFFDSEIACECRDIEYSTDNELIFNNHANFNLTLIAYRNLYNNTNNFNINEIVDIVYAINNMYARGSLINNEKYYTKGYEAYEKYIETQIRFLHEIANKHNINLTDLVNRIENHSYKKFTNTIKAKINNGKFDFNYSDYLNENPEVKKIIKSELQKYTTGNKQRTLK